jgi:hypothetical protein
MDKNKIWDLLATLLIAGMGLFTAYVCFGILDSQADAKIHNYSVQGAIAGALISTSLLASGYLHLRKSSDELDKLRKRNEELQQKIIRGAPHPPGFETEVDERQRIVLARPWDWQPRGGVIFDFQQRAEKMQPKDLFPAAFRVWFVPIGVETESEFYEKYRQSIPANPTVAAHTVEFVHLGGEPSSIKSLKLIAHHFAQVTTLVNPVTKQVERPWRYLTKEEFDRLRAEANSTTESSESTAPEQINGPQPVPAAVPAGPPKVTAVAVSVMQVVCFHKELKKIFYFDFIDDGEDFPNSSAQFNQVLDSMRFLT